MMTIQIKKMSRKGIPESLRGRAWMALTGSDRKLQAGKFEVFLDFYPYLIG
jgi:hypothetical protein